MINYYAPELQTVVNEPIYNGNSYFILYVRTCFIWQTGLLDLEVYYVHTCFIWQTGLLDLEVNTLTKVLFAAVVILSIVMMVLKVYCFSL